MAKKCAVCFQGAPRFAPELRASGFRAPKDGKCPVCDTLHDLASGIPTDKYESDQKRKVEVMKDRFHHQYWVPKGWR